MTITDEMAKELSSPFDDDSVKWKPQVTTKGKQKEPIMRQGQQVAGCTAHIDARAVMNRLDEVVGVGGWSDSYVVLPNGKNVECTLTVLGVSKSDVGEPNEGGFADLMKGAYSDALKRAAVKFGIGRYLYDMDMEWLPFDGWKILDKPQIKRQAPPSPKPDVTAAQRKPSDKQMKQFHALGKEAYGPDWDEKRAELTNVITNGRTTSSKHLTLDEWKKFIDGMEKKLA